MEVVHQPVPNLTQQGVISLLLLLLDPVDLLPPRAPGIPAVPALRGEGVLWKDSRVGVHLLLLLDGPVQGEVHISQLPLLPRRFPLLPSSFFTFLSPLPFFPFHLLPLKAVNVKEYSDEREGKAENDESLHVEKDKSLDLGAYLEEVVDQGERDRQESEALVEND